MKRIFIVSTLVILMMIQAGTLTAATLYDDFGTDYVKKSMWLDQKSNGKYWHEIVREVDMANDVLVLKLGTNKQKWPLRQGVRIPPESFPTPFTGIKADVKIVEVNNDINPPADTATVFARIAGIFYKATDVAHDSLQGDVWAELCIGYKAGSTQLEAWYEVEQFTSASSDEADELTHDTLVSGLTPGKFYTLEITYDNNNQFTMTVHDGGTELDTETFTGPLRRHIPWAESAVLDACVQDNSYEYVDGYVHAEFDDVYVNGSATVYDSFIGTEIDETKWKDREQVDLLSWKKLDYVKESINGRARMHARGQDQILRNRLALRDRYTPYLEATARIETGSYAPSAGVSKGRVRIAGHFYNFKYGPDTYNGTEGDIFAQVGLQVKGGTDNLKAKALVTEAKADGTYDDIFNEEFDATILPNTDYQLSIDYTGSQIIFSCAGETRSYTTHQTRNPPSSSNRMLDSRLYLATGERGFIKGQFDNVRVDDPTYTSLTGTWTSTVVDSQYTGDCAQSDDDTSEIEITQSGCEISATDDESTHVIGVVSGSRLLLEGSDIDGDGDQIVIKVDLSLTDENNATGTVTITSTGGCEKIETVTMTRNGTSDQDPGNDDSSGGDGGGGGCYIESLLF